MINQNSLNKETDTASKSLISSFKILEEKWIGPARASIEDWSFYNVAQYVSSFHKDELHGHECLPGFTMFGKQILQRIKYSKSSYPDPQSLSEWERQDQGNCPAHQFDHALVARVGPAVVGVLYCQWSHLGNFWYYYLRYIDVHSAWRGLGVASSLLENLDKADWLKNKAVYLTDLTDDGKRFLVGTIKKTLKPKDYIILANDYPGEDLPPSAGFWTDPWSGPSEVDPTANYLNRGTLSLLPDD